MKQMWGGILLAVGILVAGASGLCSLAVLLTPGEYSGASMWPAVLMFGGIPFALGTAMAFGGRALIQSARREGKDADGDVSKTFE